MSLKLVKRHGNDRERERGERSHLGYSNSHQLLRWKRMYVRALPTTDVNRNTEWFTYPGVWTTYILILFFSWLLVLSVFHCSPGMAWTIVHLAHFTVHFFSFNLEICLSLSLFRLDSLDSMNRVISLLNSKKKGDVSFVPLEEGNTVWGWSRDLQQVDLVGTDWQRQAAHSQPQVPHRCSHRLVSSPPPLSFQSWLC